VQALPASASRACTPPYAPSNIDQVSLIKSRIIVVDLDGTLVNTNMLVENLFCFLPVLFSSFVPVTTISSHCVAVQG